MKTMFVCVALALFFSCSEKEGSDTASSGDWVSLGCPPIDPESMAQTFTWETLSLAGEEPYMIEVYDDTYGPMAPSSGAKERWNDDGVLILWEYIPENCEVYALSLAGA